MLTKQSDIDKFFALEKIDKFNCRGAARAVWTGGSEELIGISGPVTIGHRVTGSYETVFITYSTVGLNACGVLRCPVGHKYSTDDRKLLKR